MYYNLSKLIYPINKSVYKCQVVYLFLCDLSRSQCNIHFIDSFHNVCKNFQNPSALLWIVQSIKVARLGDHGCSFPKEIPAAVISNISNIYPPVISLLKSPAYLCDKIFWRVIMGAVSSRRFRKLILLLLYRTHWDHKERWLVEVTKNYGCTFQIPENAITYPLLLYPCPNPLLIFVILHHTFPRIILSKVSNGISNFVHTVKRLSMLQDGDLIIMDLHFLTGDSPKCNCIATPIF